MPRGYRRIIVEVVGGLALLGSGFWLAGPQSERIPKYHETPIIYVENEKDGAKRGKARSGDTVGAIEAPVEKIAAEADKADERRHNANDLEAQIRAATAAEDQVPLTKIALILSILGVFGVGWTLLETRKANRLARHDAKVARMEAKAAAKESGMVLLEARRSANVAEGSLALAKDIAAVDMRPWLSIDLTLETGAEILPLGGEYTGLKFQVRRTIKNIGKTPARNVYGVADIQVVPLGRPNTVFWEDLIQKSTNHKYSGEIIFPGDSQEDVIGFFANTFMISNILTEDEMAQSSFQLWIYTSVSYESPSSERSAYYTTVRYRFTPSGQPFMEAIIGGLPIAKDKCQILRPNWACIKAT